jgi:hypothetical protein
METKELKVQVPEGYEIDKENSTFERIRFKPIKKDITYKGICNALFVNDTYFITDRGYVHKNALWDNEIIPDKNIATTEKQLKKLLALNQLLNIAEYYNKLHGNGVNSVIKYDKIKKIYVVTGAFTAYTQGIRAIFNRMEDAQAVIDNPNFREILDTIYKD